MWGQENLVKDMNQKSDVCSDAEKIGDGINEEQRTEGGMVQVVLSLNTLKMQVGFKTQPNIN